METCCVAGCCGETEEAAEKVEQATCLDRRRCRRRIQVEGFQGVQEYHDLKTYQIGVLPVLRQPGLPDASRTDRFYLILLDADIL